MNSKYTEKIRLCIHAEHQTIDYWKNYFSINPPHNIEVKLFKYSDSNYTHRVLTAQNTDCKYSCKLDDDVLISSHVLDYMMENLQAISPSHPILSPILTNGIPNVELFVKDFLNEEDQNRAYSLFLESTVPTNLWGLDYTEVNKKIKSMTKWDGREYWDFISFCDTKWDTKDVPWHYFNVRGVHPARFSMNYNLFIAQKIFENKQKFFGKNNYYLDTYQAPYFTNNMFISETKFWRDTLPMFIDGWDEGQLSLRMLMDRSSVLYVRNGFGIHMAYGMTEGHALIERNYIGNL